MDHKRSRRQACVGVGVRGMGDTMGRFFSLQGVSPISTRQRAYLGEKKNCVGGGGCVCGFVISLLSENGITVF